MLFKKIADYFRKPSEVATRPHNITDAQFAALKRLSVEGDYRTWQDVLDQRVTLIAEQLLAASDPFRLAQLQGTLVGLRLAGSLVDEALQYDLHAEHERRRPDTTARSTAAADRALYGTPAGPAHFKR